MSRFAHLPLLALSALAAPAQADQTSADAILGTYLNPDRSRTVEVYKENDLYYGVIATAPALPDGNKGVGFVVFKGFQFNPVSHVWENGRLDSPMTPRITFAGRLLLTDQGDLIVKGRGLAALAGASLFPRVRD